MIFFFFFGGSFSKIKIADILNFQWIKYLGEGLSYLKNWGIGVYYCWNYRPCKFLPHFIEYRLDPIIRFLTIVIWNLEKGKRQKLKEKHVRWPVNRKSNFYTNWICFCQIRFCSYYAFSWDQMSDSCEV